MVKEVFRTTMIDPEWLSRQLLEEGKTEQDIGQEFEVCRERIRQIAKKHQIYLKDRQASWYAKRHRIPELETADWLVKQKEEGNIGIKNLAKQLKIGADFLSHQIKRLGLAPKEFYGGVKRVNLPCAWCKKILQRRPSEVAKSKLVFCNRQECGFWKAENLKPWQKRQRSIPELEEPSWLLEQKEKGNLGLVNLARQLGIGFRTLRRRILRLGLNHKEFSSYNYKRKNS